MQRLIIFLSSFIFLSLVFQSDAQFQFVTSGYFRNVKGNNYYDLCSPSNTCPAGTEKVTQYCDANCRQYFRCKDFFCRGDTSFVGPFCHTRGCPSVFNSAYSAEAQLRWGQPADTEGMSGMGFNGQKTALPLGSEFQLGELIHYNWPIYAGTNPSEFEFVFQLSIFAPGSSVPLVNINKREFGFPMKIDETANDRLQTGCPGGDCPYNSRFPLNCRGSFPRCPDRISVTQQITRETFTLNGVEYTLALTGFRFPGQTNTLNFFDSDEGQYNVAQMFGVVTPACKCPDPNQIPKFNPKTFACDCSCAPCPPGLILKTETCACECSCCDKNIKSIFKVENNRNICTGCNCATANCAAPRVPQGDKCCCKCPLNRCANGGTVDETTADCSCKGCNTAACKRLGANYVADNLCNCVCSITDKACSASQTFKDCGCPCKCPAPGGDFKVSGAATDCNYVCDTSALAIKCAKLNRTMNHVPFDSTKCNNASCSCGTCIPQEGFVLVNGDCVCNASLPCPGEQKRNPTTCKCECPPTGPQCGAGTTPGANCNCLSCGRKTLQDCRPTPFSLSILTTPDECNCTCPPTAASTCLAPRVFDPKTCECRPCKAGECVCGNGIIEDGEDCDPGNSTQECCKDCKWILGATCNLNKCGVCRRTDLTNTTAAPVCVDNSVALCNASNDCNERTCQTNGQTHQCIEKFLDDQPCGDKNLCLRRCAGGVCVPYDQDVVDKRCDKRTDNITESCGECCEYTCDPLNGKCKINWNDTLPCTDGKFCTLNDKCVKPTNPAVTSPFVCVGETPKCTTEQLNNTQPAGYPCNVWDCSEAQFGKCISIPVNSTNITCPGTGFCNLEGLCSTSGECIRPRRECEKPGPCVEVRCRESKGICETSTELADGIPCDDGDNCTTNDRCSGGKCAGDQGNCTIPPTGGTPLTIPLAVTGAVVATGAAVAGFFVYQAMQKANIMDPVSWGEMNANQFDNNPLYQENTKFGENPLFRS